MKIDELTFGNDIDNLIAAHSLEHEQCSKSFMQREISGSVEESGLQCGHLLRGHLNRHFSFLFSFFFFFCRIIVYGLCAEWKDKMRWYRYRGVEWMDRGKYYIGQFRPPRPRAAAALLHRRALLI